MNAIKIMTFWLLLSVALQAQQSDQTGIKYNRYQLGFGLGYQSRQLLDEQKSAYHTVPVGDYRNAAGENLEGTGIAPDYYARSTKDETLVGIDRGLEKALELLQ